MFISFGMLAIIVIAAYVLGVMTPILFTTHLLSRKEKPGQDK